MVQDIAAKKLYNEYTNKRPAQTDYMVVFQQKKILARKLHGRICLPRLSDLLADGMSLNENADSQYLFRINEEQYFLYPDLLNPDVMSDVQWISLAQIRSQAEHEICFAAYTAYHLYQWYQSNRFCGCCGSRTVPDQQERMLYCTQCGNQIYPRISPAVIVAVTNGDQILLTRYANREYQRYALVAGFTEIGETAEETVRREVMEETGVSVKNIRYYKSQPWGVDGNLLLGYFAELDGSAEIRMDEQELSAAQWAGWEDLKDMDDSFSLTGEMMRVFYEQQRNHFIKSDL